MEAYGWKELDTLTHSIMEPNEEETGERHVEARANFTITKTWTQAR